MSLQAITWVLDFSQTGGVDRLMMVVLGHYASNDGGYVAVSRARLAAETRLSEITVKRILDRLIATTDEVVDAAPGDAPDWWMAYPANRRPRLMILPLFAATRLGVPNEPPASKQGARRGRVGGACQASDLGERNANVERRKEKEAAAEIEADPGCVRCRGTGLIPLGGGVGDRPCTCIDPPPDLSQTS